MYDVDRKQMWGNRGRGPGPQGGPYARPRPRGAPALLLLPPSAGPLGARARGVRRACSAPRAPGVRGGLGDE